MHVSVNLNCPEWRNISLNICLSVCVCDCDHADESMNGWMIDIALPCLSIFSKFSWLLGVCLWNIHHFFIFVNTTNATMMNILNMFWRIGLIISSLFKDVMFFWSLNVFYELREITFLIMMNWYYVCFLCKNQISMQCTLSSSKTSDLYVSSQCFSIFFEPTYTFLHAKDHTPTAKNVTNWHTVT